ncbi:MAG: 2-amino-4-hydroxy-6-hydroxymethyldihydropteridine pyrophosphokinae [Nevskia sp.]|nr:2-amino-4-hydroxy-6-hydroxymethyldihydropteridine pyrophosphokinae [Nevskia sp.]
MTAAYIGLGANLGDPPAQLRVALDRIAQSPGIVLGPVSRFYRSAPLGPAGQSDYCNAVCAVDTQLSADALLSVLQGIEAAAGRVRGERWGPRVLDLDLLWVDGVVSNTARLSLPHPQLHLRAFVLVPLAELAPQLQLPGLGRVEQLAAAIDRSGLRLASD